MSRNFVEFSSVVSLILLWYMLNFSKSSSLVFFFLLRKYCQHIVCIISLLQKLQHHLLYKEKRMPKMNSLKNLTHTMTILNVRFNKAIQAKRKTIYKCRNSKTYVIKEKQKKRTYNERILQVEHGSFTTLVMSATGGIKN